MLSHKFPVPNKINFIIKIHQIIS